MIETFSRLSLVAAFLVDVVVTHAGPQLCPEAHRLQADRERSPDHSACEPGDERDPEVVERVVPGLEQQQVAGDQQAESHRHGGHWSDQAYDDGHLLAKPTIAVGAVARIFARLR